MDLPAGGHPRIVNGVSAALPLSGRAPAPARTSEVVAPPLTFEAVYEDSLDFVWRSLQSLGVRDDTLDDAVQDVFLVVHRRLAEFEARSTVRTWVFGIAIRVARDHRRRRQRKGGLSPLDFDIASIGPGPYEEAERAEALREVALVLEQLDEDKREIFVLSELEQLTAPEIGAALGVNVNTIYSRVRAARREFDENLERLRGGRP